MENPGYYGILPANVRYDKNLKPMEKIMYSELTALCNKNGYCNATNSYFAELYEVSKNTVSLWIGDLEKAGYIKTKLIYEPGTKNIKERRIFIADPITKNDDTYHEKEVDPITKNDDTYHEKEVDPITKNDDTYHEKEVDPITKNDDTPITKNREDNNTSINNTSRILKEKNIKKEKSKNEVEIYINNLDLDDDYKQLLFKYVEYRKSIKKQIKTIVPIQKIIKDFPNYFSLDEAINIAMEKEWQGLEPEWIAKYKLSKTNNTNNKLAQSKDTSEFLVDDNYIDQMKERYGL